MRRIAWPALSRRIAWPALAGRIAGPALAGRIAGPALAGRIAWPALALVAALALLLAAWFGGSERRSLTAFVPAGPLADVPLESVRAIELRRGDRVRRYVRAGETWRGAGFDASREQLQALDLALTLLRNAAPERRFDVPGEQPDPLESGLAPPQLAVTIDATRRVQIEFGHANPAGHARYARLAGEPPMLLPRYVADAWEAAAGLREAPR